MAAWPSGVEPHLRKIVDSLTRSLPPTVILRDQALSRGFDEGGFFVVEEQIGPSSALTEQQPRLQKDLMAPETRDHVAAPTRFR